MIYLNNTIPPRCVDSHLRCKENLLLIGYTITLSKKGAKAVTGVVPFQKLQMYILGSNMYI